MIISIPQNTSSSFTMAVSNLVYLLLVLTT